MDRSSDNFKFFGKLVMDTAGLEDIVAEGVEADMAMVV